MVTHRQTKKEMIATVTVEIASSKLIANNTVEYYDNEGVKYIRYHNTDIIIDDGVTTRLYSGGWRTKTTRERFNEYGPINVYQEKGEWFVYDNNVAAYPFYDGIEIKNATGNVKTYMPDELQAEIDAQIEHVRLNKLIKKYCKIVKDMDTLPMPEGGDCWFCSMVDATGTPWGDIKGTSNDHLVSHLEEEYVHGSLLWNALRWAGYHPDVYLYGAWGPRESVVRSVRRYFRAKLGFAS